MKKEYEINPKNENLISFDLRRDYTAKFSDTIRVLISKNRNSIEIQQSISRNYTELEARITLSGEEALKLKQFIEDLVK